jgi:heparin binding hemagglutinin HbhA
VTERIDMPLTRSKPFYVVAGVSDLAVEKLRAAQTALTSVRLDRAEVEKRLADLQKETAALPTRATALASGVVGKGTEVYSELVVRGRDIVTRIRRQAATQELQQKVALTKRRTKAAERTLVESAEETSAARKRASTTAKKRAATTRKAATSAAKAAGETAVAAGRAVADGAEKLG